MSKFKHTPGPWEHGSRYGGNPRDLRDEITADNGHRVVAIAWTRQYGLNRETQHSDIIDDESGTANATLIAAAPKMLDALIELYNRIGNENMAWVFRYKDYLKPILERATGMTIDEAIKAYEAEHEAN